MQPGALEHLTALIFVAGSTDHHIGDAAQVREVEGAMMGGTVLSYETGAINRQRDIQVL